MLVLDRCQVVVSRPQMRVGWTTGGKVGTYYIIPSAIKEVQTRASCNVLVLDNNHSRLYHIVLLEDLPISPVAS